MYINKPLIKVERVRGPERRASQTPSGQKKKSPKAVNISLKSFVNWRISNRIGPNCWKLAIKRSKEQKNKKYKSKTMKPLFTVKLSWKKSMRPNNKNFPKYADN